MGRHIPRYNERIVFLATPTSLESHCGWVVIAVEGHPGVRPELINMESDRTHPSRRDHIAGVTLPPMEPFGPRPAALRSMVVVTKPCLGHLPLRKTG